MNSGKQANTTGIRLERHLENQLRDNGYEKLNKDKEKHFNNRSILKGKFYITQVPTGLTIYDTNRKADFLIINPDKFPNGLIIECKWQQTSGTADEKYPYLVLNIRKANIPTIVLLDGGGYKKEARQWLLDQVHNQDNPNLLAVWNITECLRNSNNGYF